MVPARESTVVLPMGFFEAKWVADTFTNERGVFTIPPYPDVSVDDAAKLGKPLMR